jgi:putative ABC transport system permease protein
MARQPLYPGVCLVILSMGLAAVVTAFAYLDSFSRTFPGVQAEGLVQVFGTEAEEPWLNVSYLDYLDYAGANRSLTGLTAVVNYFAASVRHEEMTEVAFLEAVSGSFFHVLGVDASLGRLLTPEDDRLESPPAAVLSWAWWQSRFQGDAGVIGRTLYLNFRPYTIVGVASPAFLGTVADSRPHVWVPIAHFRDRYVSWDRLALDRDVPLVRVFGRLSGTATPEQASTELNGLARDLDEAYPRPEHRRSIRVRSATWIDPRVEQAESSTNRIMLLSAVGFLLLVCANAANLLLTLFSTKRKAFALRSALGASPGRISAEILTQNLLLAGLAGAVALGLALPLTRRLGSYFERPSIWAENVAREFALDGRVVAFSVLAALVTGLLAGALPVLDVSRRGATDILKSETSQGGPRRRVLRIRIPDTRELLVSAQVMLAVVLLVVSGLVLKTLSVASEVDPGFRYDRLVGSHVSTSSTRVQPAERERFFRDLEDRIAEEPWVASATVSGNAPLSGHGSAAVRAEGEEVELSVLVDPVHVGFFEKLGIPLRDGRPFSELDSAGTTQVAILNAPAAERLFPGRGAVGRRIAFRRADGSDGPLEVVGVVGDVKMGDFLAPARPAVYLPYAQQTYPTGSALLVTTNVAPERAVTLLQQWLRTYEPHLAIVNSISYRDVVRGALYVQRMNAELFSVLAALGLVLGCAGVFSVVSLSVARRRREIGIRKAVGSTASDIDLLIVREAMGPVLIGAAGGVAVAYAGSRFVGTLLYGVEASDPTVLASGLAVLILVSLVAAVVPAVRASRADPARALRAD